MRTRSAQQQFYSSNRDSMVRLPSPWTGSSQPETVFRRLRSKWLSLSTSLEPRELYSQQPAISNLFFLSFFLSKFRLARSSNLLVIFTIVFALPRKRSRLVSPRSHCSLAMGDKSLDSRSFADSMAIRRFSPRDRKDTIVPDQRFCEKSIDS